MSSEAFESSLPFVLRWEGGFVDHPADPGGRTNKGVTQRTYDAWREKNGMTQRDVRHIEDREVKAIYEAEYWQRAGCDRLQSQLDLVQFDTAVNMGVRRAIRFLQGSVGCGVDGVFGPQTENAAARCDPRSAIRDYCDAREDYYRRLAERNPKLAVFLRGWLNRLNALRSAVGLPGQRAALQNPAEPIARIPDIGEDRAYDF